MKRILIPGIFLLTVSATHAQRESESLIVIDRSYISTPANNYQPQAKETHLYTCCGNVSVDDNTRQFKLDLFNYDVQTVFKREDNISPGEEPLQQNRSTRCRSGSILIIEDVRVRNTNKAVNKKTDSVEILLGGIPGTFGDIPENIETQSSVITGNQEDTEAKTGPGPVTGIEGHNFIESPAIIYPNPVQGVMQVKSADPITVIEILNLHGQVIKSFVADEVLSVEEFAAGNYYVRIYFEKHQVQVEKIIITN